MMCRLKMIQFHYSLMRAFGNSRKRAVVKAVVSAVGRTTYTDPGRWWK